MALKKRSKKIVVIGGGTGVYTVLTGLKKYPVFLSAVVSMADNGGSTKILREEFGILPPGSVRPALVALSNSEKLLSDLFNYRFEKGSFNGHNFGNLLITALTEMTGSFEKALEGTGRILNINGRVIPSTLDYANLFARLENGEIVKGETDIDVPKHDGNLKIERIYFDPPCSVNKDAIKTILEADLIVIGPGDLYSSILPNLLFKEIIQAIRESKAKKVYVCNLMTKFGETNNFTAKDFIDRIEEYLGEKILDYVVFNNKKPSRTRILKYEKEKAEFVKLKDQDLKDKKIKIIEGNFLRPRGFIRHDPDELAKALMKLRGLTVHSEAHCELPAVSSPLSAERNPPKQKTGIHPRPYGRGFLRRRIKL